MLSNSVCNHGVQQKSDSPMLLCNFVNHFYDYRWNWSPLSPIIPLLISYDKFSGLKITVKIDIVL